MVRMTEIKKQKNKGQRRKQEAKNKIKLRDGVFLKKKGKRKGVTKVRENERNVIKRRSKPAAKNQISRKIQKK